ncbi:MAG: tetratricopeptide repeat protein [Deltaproteobacteria bacterium]|nr:tetratricopeptide repeat protein [Deltaproteobacteria bacterium]
MTVTIDRFVLVPGKGLVRLAAADGSEPPPPVSDDLRPVYLALRHGDLARARSLLDALVPEPAELNHVAALRVFAQMLAGELTAAHDLALQLDEQAFAHNTVRSAYAAVLLVAGENEEAARLLEEVLNEDPRHEIARYVYALWRAQSGELQSAHDLLVSLCRDYPDHALARLQLGQVLMAAGDVARAGTLFEAAIDGAPMLAQGWERFASLLVVGGQPQEALLVAKRGLSWHPGSRPLLEILARSALAVGAFDIAVDATRLVLATCDDDPVAFANYAVALTAANRRDSALVTLRDAIGRFPNDDPLRQLKSEIEGATR